MGRTLRSRTIPQVDDGNSQNSLTSPTQDGNNQIESLQKDSEPKNSELYSKSDEDVTPAEESEDDDYTPSICKKQNATKVKCDVCDKQFTRKASLKDHMMVHTGKKPFSCGDCAKSFRTKSQLTSHETVHTNSLECSVCNKHLTTKYNLKMHMASHNKEPLFLCSHCGKTFTWQTEYRRHMNKHTGKYKCDVCGKHCSTKYALSSHVATHSNEKPFKCSECGKTFAWRMQWQSHLNQHVGKYKCSYCDKEFSTAGSLARHVSIHTGDRPYKCSICDVSFRWKSNLQTHMNKHDGTFTCRFCLKRLSCKRMLVQHLMSHKKVRPHKCKECGKSFTWKAQLCAHMNLHRGLFTCEVCGRTLSSKQSLVNHQKSVHQKDDSVVSASQDTSQTATVIESQNNDLYNNNPTLDSSNYIHPEMGYPSVPNSLTINYDNVNYSVGPVFPNASAEKPYRCDVCGKTFTRKYQCGQHMNKHRGVYKCKFCLKQFVNKESLDSHESSHSHVMAFRCDECGKGFAWKAKWRLHMNQHRGMYTCEICNRQFSSNQSLTRHQAAHKTDRPFPCTLCKKTFRWKSNLQAHMQKHAGGFECDLCKRRFSSNQFLKEHKASHGKERPYECTVCPRTFKWKTQLSSHMNQHKGTYTCQSCGKAFASNRNLRKHKCKPVYEIPSDCEELRNYFSANESVEREEGSMSGGNDGPNDTDGESNSENPEMMSNTIPSTELPCEKTAENLPDPTNTNQSNNCDNPIVNAMTSLYTFESLSQPNVEDLQIPRVNENIPVDEEPFKCEQCNKGYKFQSHLWQHMNTHQVMYTCDVCDKQFSSQHRLTSHFLIHASRRAFACEVCGKTFRWKVQWEAHKMLHENEMGNATRVENCATDSSMVIENFKCDQCEKMFELESQFVEHVATHQVQTQNDLTAKSKNEFNCEECGKSFRWKRQWYTHMNMHKGMHECTTCKKHFATPECLAIHQRTHTDERPFKCDQCGKAFRAKSHWKTHMNMHKGVYTCEICDKQFATRRFLNEHIECHFNRNPYKCDECGKTFKWKSQLSTHTNQHKGRYKCELCKRQLSSSRSLADHVCYLKDEREVFKCKLGCDLEFTSKPSLRKHYTAHSQGKISVGENKDDDGGRKAAKPFQCDECDRTFSRRQHLRDHKNVHKGMYKCEVCKRQFASQMSLLGHFCHLNPNVETHMCEVCGKQFHNLRSLKKHSQTHETSKKEGSDVDIAKYLNVEICEDGDDNVCKDNRIEGTVKSNDVVSSVGKDVKDANKSRSAKAFSCDECEKDFTRKTDLYRHMIEHSGQYKCEICYRSFTSKETLAAHSSIHTNERPFKCDSCDKAFAWKSQLTVHSQVHKGVYKCEVCNRQCDCRSSLARHKLIHTKEKPFLCEECGKTFRYKYHYHEHLNKHKGMNTCEICGKQFASAYFLRQHLSHHNNEKPYKCSLCDKSFAWKSQWCNHVNLHKGMYRCQVCGKDCPNNQCLAKHVLTHSIEGGNLQQGSTGMLPLDVNSFAPTTQLQPQLELPPQSLVGQNMQNAACEVPPMPCAPDFSYFAMHEEIW